MYNFIAPKAKVLIVDDNMVTLNFEKELFQKYKMNISIAKNGFECLELIKKEKFDIIFIDHIMPDIDGISTANNIRNIPDDYYKNLTLIALTCNDSPNILSNYIKNGFNDFIKKPINNKILSCVLKTYIPRNVIEDCNIFNKEITKSYDLNIPNIDLKNAFIYFENDINKYLSLLTVAYDDGINRCSLIKKYALNRDIKNYMIEVHSLKSVCAIIGDYNLSDLASQHEEEALNGNLEFVIKNHENIIMKYEAFLSNIRPFIIPSKIPHLNVLKKFNKTKVLNLIKSLINSIDDFDLDESFKCLDELSRYNFKKIQIELLSKIKECLNIFDYDSAYTLALTLNKEFITS